MMAHKSGRSLCVPGFTRHAAEVFNTHPNPVLFRMQPRKVQLMSSLLSTITREQGLDFKVKYIGKTLFFVLK